MRLTTNITTDSIQALIWALWRGKQLNPFMHLSFHHLYAFPPSFPTSFGCLSVCIVEVNYYAKSCWTDPPSSTQGNKNTPLHLWAFGGLMISTLTQYHYTDPETACSPVHCYSKSAHSQPFCGRWLIPSCSCSVTTQSCASVQWISRHKAVILSFLFSHWNCVNGSMLSGDHTSFTPWAYWEWTLKATAVLFPQ